jgi:superfamily II DNA or RNA helicase
MPEPSRRVELLKAGNFFAVDPTTDKILELLDGQLSYVEKQTLHAKALYDALKVGAPRVRLIPTDLYTRDHKGRIVTLAGFRARVTRVLTVAGYDVRFSDLEPHPKPGVYRPDWAQLDPYELRHGQDEFLLKLASNECGRFDCPTGWGKSFMIGMVASIFRQARIDVVSKRIPVIEKTIYPELCGMLPSVGICTGSRKVLGRRVTCFSAGSLHKSDGKADILLWDECHEAAGDSFAAGIAKYTRARRYGLSASHDMRNDGKDARLEGIFGPVIYSLSYQEAEAHDLVVPIVVKWRSVHGDANICAGLVDTEKYRAGIWTNTHRNRLVAEDASSYKPDEQVLVVVDTIEHAVHLKKLLPGFTLVHAEGGMSERDRRYYVKHKLISPDEPEMTRRRLDALKNGFESGALKKVIATTVWNVGVNFRRLGVLVRADAGAAGSDDIQILGRVSRAFEGKDFGVIHEYEDQFDSGYRAKACARERNYESRGFRNVHPPRPPKGSLHSYLFD